MTNVMTLRPDVMTLRGQWLNNVMTLRLRRYDTTGKSRRNVMTLRPDVMTDTGERYDTTLLRYDTTALFS